MTAPTAGSDALRAAELPAGATRATRLRSAIAGVGATVLGAAPHVLHHVGPLAGAAILAGATGKLLFGAIGFVIAIPMLRRLRRRHGSWTVPGGALALMAVAFTFSAVVIGPALTGVDETATPTTNTPEQTIPDTRPSGAGEHQAHHR